MASTVPTDSCWLRPRQEIPKLALPTALLLTSASLQHHAFGAFGGAVVQVAAAVTDMPVACADSPET